MKQANEDVQLLRAKRRATAKHVVVMVLGDIGRSPRMQYHTLSLLEEGHYVTLIGYAGEGLIPPLKLALIAQPTSQPKPSYHGCLHVLRMVPHVPPKTNILYRLLYYPIRLLSLLYCVIFTLWIRLNSVPHTAPVDTVLVQNPPSVPTLILAYLFCVWQGIWKRHRPRLIIDWHNLGYTMFEYPNPTAPPSQALVKKSIRKIAEYYERNMAPLADAHLTVTEAMADWLGENFNVHGERVRVLYDKPPLMFRPTAIEEQHEIFSRLNLEGKEVNASSDDMQQKQAKGRIIEETIFTQSMQEIDGSLSFRLRSDRPALLVSSTSWTPDEDFSILLNALKKLHKMIEQKSVHESFPKVIVIVTGKGPEKSHYLPHLKDFNKTHLFIKVYTLWLEASDYPKLLGCATLGISLHTSTSGLDLPMKVLDMFGCHVPVCAIGFECLGELVKDGVNGKVFGGGDELATQLFDLLSGYPSDGTLNELERYRCNIRGMMRWKENWEECARHLILGDWNTIQ
mmetsp:Transcript_26720/g.64108  ORF Transcript_26720/g.64108 Transcript_26720/m.64108 type:complete len:511 (+) Transcript_26720:3-1535(+)